MNRYELLLDTPAVSLATFDHPPGAVHADPEFEVAPNYSISFVDEGSFDVRVGSQEWRFDPGSMFVTASGMAFTCTHDCDQPTDRCLSVTFTDDAWEDVRVAGIPALRPPHAARATRQSFIRHRLASCGPGQEMRLEILAGALAESLTHGEVRVRTAGQLADLIPRIDRAVELIDASYARSLTLRELATAATMSPFHFARVFRELVGQPPHRYLMSVRLRHAARLLEAGASVTHACYDVGFLSLSHFITVFRERFGMVPSRVRSSRRGARRRPLPVPRWTHR